MRKPTPIKNLNYEQLNFAQNTASILCLPAASLVTNHQADCLYELQKSEFIGCGGWDRTTGLQVMSLTSYHCSTPRYIFPVTYFRCYLSAPPNAFNSLLQLPAKPLRLPALAIAVARFGWCDYSPFGWPPLSNCIHSLERYSAPPDIGYFGNRVQRYGFILIYANFCRTFCCFYTLRWGLVGGVFRVYLREWFGIYRILSSILSSILGVLLRAFFNLRPYLR